jgi:zinc transport system substrate-binding protein
MKQKRNTALLSAGIALLCAIILLALAPGCKSPSTTPAEMGKIRAIVTIPPLAGFLKQVGGDKVDVTTMVKPGSDPHTASFEPSQLESLSNADVFFMVGSGLEFELANMSAIRDANPDMKIIDCSQGIELLDMDEDEAEGHNHHGQDPHIWTSPLNAKCMVETLCSALTEIDPDNSEYYTSNRDNYLALLDLLDGYLRYKLTQPADTIFLTYHPSYGYLSHEYGLTQVAVEDSGGDTTGPALTECINTAKEHRLQYIFLDSRFAPEVCKSLAADIGASIISVNPLDEDYINSMKDLADHLTDEFAT